nr:serine/threonine-protein kinase [uncultured Ruminococcus sp.]
MAICYSCFNEYGDEFDVCPFCGTIKHTDPSEPVYLKPGTMLANRYLVGYDVNAGGFGIVYRAWDTKLETIVAIKEFFANRLMTRAAGETQVIVNKKAGQEYEYRKKRFLAEARTMAKFGKHRNIPNVFESFEENGTAYIVMELLTGQALNEYLQENGNAVDHDFAIHIAAEVGKALISMHEMGIIHRDVAPDNIFICEDTRVLLLDLGAAKLADDTDTVIDIILKPGYSPVEQYDNTASMGNWTDIYALGATLYVMLTGIKPDESTNRKINDSLTPPHDIDPDIPENLSNAVLKAMAIDRHMRFKTVEDFLKAINGEKKIIPLKKEKRRRAGKRIIGIVAAVLAVLLLSGVVVQVYSKKKAEQGLPDSRITIWFSVNDDSAESDAMSAVAADFHDKHKNVNVTLTAIPAADYPAKIAEAAKAGKLPTLFESTGVSDDILRNAADISPILESEQAKSCLFLDQYVAYYSDRKKIPLAIKVPMAYVITSGNVSVDYSDSTFSSLADFGTDKIAYDEDHMDVISANFPEEPSAEKNEFMDSEENTCAVMLSDNMAMNKVRETLTGYSKNYVYYAADEVYCRYDYEWSIGSGTKAQQQAAERLLSWMLGNNYQNTLMISRCSDGQIPINQDCFETKLEQKNYAEIKNIYSKYRFEK